MGEYLFMPVNGKLGRYLLVGIRWALLSAGIVLYAPDIGAVSAGVVLEAVLLLALCTAAALGKLKNRYAAGLAGADLLFQAYLLWATGGLSGPFVFYSLSGLAAFKRYLRWNAFYAAVVLYTAALPVLLALTEGEKVYDYLADHWIYLIDVGLFCALIGIVRYTYLGVTVHLKKLVLIYASGRPEGETEQWAAVQDTEDLLKRLLDRRDVWLCVEASGLREPDPSWERAYYTEELRRQQPSGDKPYRRLVTPIGETVSLYVRTLRDRRGSEYGWLLVEAEQDGLSIVQQAYIRLALMRFEADYDLNKRLKTMRDGAIALERNAIAQKIHDGIAQELFFYSVQLYQLRSRLQKDDNGEALQLVSEIEKKVKESHRDIRRFIEELKGEKRRFHLLDAIEKMLRRITDQTGIKLVFENAGRVPQERIEFEETIYHFIEEAANNVVKHAEASRLKVRLEVTSVQWAIAIQDDGKGIKEGLEAASKGKYGLQGMMDRIKGLNGTISIQSGEASGTTIIAAIPRERSLAHA